MQEATTTPPQKPIDSTELIQRATAEYHRVILGEITVDEAQWLEKNSSGYYVMLADGEGAPIPQ